MILKTLFIFAICAIQFLFVIPHAFAGETRIRERVMKPDDILTVNTGLGLATIVQLPETIQSMIIGDQSAFKVEYLDRAVTIKPLRLGAKTNLYLITQSRRFDLKLQTVRQDSAEYVIYVKPAQDKDITRWRPLSLKAKSSKLELIIDRWAVTGDQFVLFEARLINHGSSEITVLPENVWVTQGGKSKVLNSLFQSSLKIANGKPVLLGMSILKSDLETSSGVTLEIRAPEKVSITIPASSLWK